jgi:hypothetical protein
LIRHNYDLGLKKKIITKKNDKKIKLRKKTNYKQKKTLLRTDRQTDGQPKTIVRYLTINIDGK